MAEGNADISSKPVGNVCTCKPLVMWGTVSPHTDQLSQQELAVLEGTLCRAAPRSKSVYT